MIAWHRVCTPLLLGLRLGRPPPAGRGRLLASVAEEGFVPSREAADTIFALSSGAGRAGVSVIRVSGPQARDAILELAPITTGELPPPRRAVLRSVVWPELAGAGQREVIDQALVLWFPGPRSFTGEDVVEFHTHGSRAVVTAVLEALGSLRGLRLADPGEFTRQAFQSGKMELTQVEGLGDLINADTEEQRKQALAQMGGVQHGPAGLKRRPPCVRTAPHLHPWAIRRPRPLVRTPERRQSSVEARGGLRSPPPGWPKVEGFALAARRKAQYEAWRAQLLKSLAYTEALIDFGEDADDVTVDALGVARADVRALREALSAQLSDGKRGEVVREGVRVAILGPPNAGKSTLLNALAQREAAIVSPVAGTTRDVVGATPPLLTLATAHTIPPPSPSLPP